MRGRVAKRCGCLDEEGKQLGGRCPRLKKKDGSYSSRHGTWYATYSSYVRGERRQKVKGGFGTAAEAQAHIDEQKVRITSGADVTRDKLTVGEWVQEWLDARSSKIRPNTRMSYQGHIDRYIVPQIGHVRLTDLRAAHVAAMLTRCKGQGVTAQRCRATLRGALNSAVKQRLVTHNAASEVELPAAKRPTPVVWTRPRVAEWERTGKKPSSVMVWTATQTGAFLDSVQDDRLAAMWLIFLTRGPRRGELAGLRWSDVDLDERTMTIALQRISIRGVVQEGPPKSDAGGRVVALGAGNVAALTSHRHAQRLDRLRAGTAWVASGKVFTDELGAALDPAWISDRWETLVGEAEAPPVRLHDARHTAATVMLASGSSPKTVQDQLGHASILTTMGTYASVYPEIAHESADAAAAMIPRAIRS